MPNNNASVRLINGLGDRLLDTIGFVVLCKHLNYKPNVIFCNNGVQGWGIPIYDLRLFNFNEVTIADNDCDFNINYHAPSCSFCPYKVYEFVNKFIEDITFERITNDYVEYSKKIIQPSEIILSKIPNNIEKAYGIHLRKTDKCNDNGNLAHENTLSEFEIITKKLLEDVECIIISEEEPTFLIVSEDNNWKIEITNIIKNISSKTNKQIKIIDVAYDDKSDYFNHDAVLDMFCLSKCKEILQGVKYSTFSVLASLLGNNNLRNYSNYTDTYYFNILRGWSSVIKINNNKYLDVEYHKDVTKNFTILQTNIDKIGD